MMTISCRQSVVVARSRASTSRPSARAPAARVRRRNLRAAATPSSSSQDEAEAPSSPPPPPVQPEQPAVRGQTTAIVTGVVSIAFGVLYLALVQLLDSRGGELLPPPPEAFGFWSEQRIMPGLPSCAVHSTGSSIAPIMANCGAHPFLAAKRLFGCTRTRRTMQICAARKDQDSNVSYGRDWYQQTRNPTQGRTVRQELERRREANRVANNGRDRKDLYTDKWDGDQFKGSGVNELTIILAVSILTPLAGLVFAYFTFGTLWG